MFKEDITTLPLAEFVTLAQAKAHARVEIADEDGLINQFILAARKHAETYTNRFYIGRNFILTLDKSEVCKIINTGTQNKVLDINSIKFFDTENVETLVPATDYRFLNNRIILDEAAIKALGSPRIEDALIIDYTITAIAPTEAIRVAMMDMITHWYENREAVMNKEHFVLPGKVIALLETERDYAV